jgi:hypothetical protein
MITALIPSGRYLTVRDVLILELPHFTEEFQQFALWEHTGFPAFFSGNDHPINELRRDLRAFREGKAVEV